MQNAKREKTSIFRHVFRGKASFFYGAGMALALAAVAALVFLKVGTGRADFEIIDPLGGNIFPSAVLSVATTEAMVVLPMDSTYVGNPKAPFAIRLHAKKAGSRVRVELQETPYFAHSVSEFVLPQGDKDYVIYPDVLWNYDRLLRNAQARPVSVVATVWLNGHDCGQDVRTFSVRSINECLLGYMELLPDRSTRFHSTKLFFAAYVDEENPQIDGLLREALNTRIVRSFLGYQQGTAASVDKQVYALWYVLQNRGFRYSSVSNSSLSSNVAYSQRVRTFSDALKSSQVNCVDGSVLFASLLRAINITPILVKTPGHMFVGYYSDSSRKALTFLETTMIGNVDLDDYFPEEKLDSTMAGMSRQQASRIAFEKSKEYASKKYTASEKFIRSNKPGYMFLEISKNVRKDIQPLGQ